MAGYAASVGYPEIQWMQDRGGELARRFGIVSLGSTVVFDAQGKVVFQDAGFTPYRTLAAAVGEALRR